MRFAITATLLCTAALSASDAKPTYHKDVVPVLQARCQGCHRPGEAAPFSMLTYKDTRPWAKAMKAAVASRKMPPWFSDARRGHFKNDSTLPQTEIDILSRWADSGAPEGKVKDAPKPLQFINGWNIGTPDVVFEMPEAFEVPATGTVDYQWVVMPTGFTEDKWLQGVEVRPGERSVVHHVIAFYRRPGSKWLADAKPGIPVAKGSGMPETGMSDGSIGGYVPGLPARALSGGRAILLPKGSDLVMQLHYTASGKAVKDRTKVGIVFAKEPPKERMVGIAVGNSRFVIPPGADNHRVDGEITLGSDLRLVDFTPHMHLRGKSFEYRAIFPDGTEEVLLNVPRYDFNWQITYQLASERVLPKGTRIHGTAYFDNSANNRFNPDPTAPVRFGDQTWDEMMVGFMNIAVAPDFDLKKLIQAPPRPAATTGE